MWVHRVKFRLSGLTVVPLPILLALASVFFVWRMGLFLPISWGGWEG